MELSSTSGYVLDEKAEMILESNVDSSIRDSGWRFSMMSPYDFLDSANSYIANYCHILS
jgi:hypothetical protein